MFLVYVFVLLLLLALPGKELRAKGLNRIGNMLVPNSNYCLFEDWIMPLLDDMLKEQQEQGTVWTPSKVRAVSSRAGSGQAQQGRRSRAGAAEPVVYRAVL